MTKFVIQEWHVVVLFFSLVATAIKVDIINAINNFVMVRNQKKLKGKFILLLGADGTWNEVRILDFHYAIPLFKSGGVLIAHGDSRTGYLQETVSFQHWKSQRIRISSSSEASYKN
jgi:hypothetical protein